MTANVTTGAIFATVTEWHIGHSHFISCTCGMNDSRFPRVLPTDFDISDMKGISAWLGNFQGTLELAAPCVSFWCNAFVKIWFLTCGRSPFFHSACFSERIVSVRRLFIHEALRFTKVHFFATLYIVIQLLAKFSRLFFLVKMPSSL